MNLPLRLILVAALGAPASLALAQSSPDAVDAPRARRGGAHRHARGRHHRGRHGHHLRRMLRELNLTDNQKAQVRAIFESSRERRAELRGQGRSPETREAMRNLRRETKRLVMEVLTPAQRTRANELRVAAIQRHMDRRMEHMTRRLELTDAQKTAVRGILERTHERRRALRESATVNPDAVRALRAQTRTELSGVLSAEQMAELREMRVEHRARRGNRPNRGHRGNRVPPIRNAAP